MLGYSVQSEAVIRALPGPGGRLDPLRGERALNVGRRFQVRELVMMGVFLGFIAGYGTDLILTWAGA